jgi:ribosome-associated protein
VVLDYGEVVVHLMTREARDYYDLEGFWADAERV